MSDKSKMPDLKEISGMAGKLFSDVKKSVVEIVDDYNVNSNVMFNMQRHRHRM